ncbi:MAG: hypothetical protein Q3965_03545, partial [Rothia sp. (in: high G+C Gram-positive bacteria)]|nr:hypothetical protein [Rothia sp. (in: high G+C Gram-positive bacteria)]
RYRVDLDPKFTALNDTEPYYTVSMGPFAIPRYNVSLALYFAAPPLDIRRIIWAGEVEDKNKLEDTPLAQGTYYSYSYPLIEDTLLAFRWKSQREKALAKYRLQS